MKKYYNKGSGINFMFILCCFLGCEMPNCLAGEKRGYEPGVDGVMIVSMDIPMVETIGNKVNVDIVIGNERTTKVTTILTVTCLTTKQLIGRNAETLDSLSSKKIVYSWDTNGLKEDTYTIRAELEKVPGETYLDDNIRQVNIYLVP